MKPLRYWLSFGGTLVSTMSPHSSFCMKYFSLVTLQRSNILRVALLMKRASSHPSPTTTSVRVKLGTFTKKALLKLQLLHQTIKQLSGISFKHDQNQFFLDIRTPISKFELFRI